MCFENDEISYVIRCHSVDTIPRLKDALASVAGQQYHNVHAHIAVQNLSDDDLFKINEAAQQMARCCGLRYTIQNVPFEQPGDHRGALLNRAADHVTSRYLAVLDFDDVVYPNHARVLIEDLTSHPDHATAASFCGCIRAQFDRTGANQIMITDKIVFASSPSVSQCLIDNCFPIHSYVIDRARMSRQPRYWEEKSVFEDYWFLIELFQNYPVSTRCLDQHLCEYRLGNAGGNTVLPTERQRRNNPQQQQEWEEAKIKLEAHKRGKSFNVPYDELLHRSQSLPRRAYMGARRLAALHLKRYLR